MDNFKKSWMLCSANFGEWTAKRLFSCWQQWFCMGFHIKQVYLLHGYSGEKWRMILQILFSQLISMRKQRSGLSCSVPIIKLFGLSLIERPILISRLNLKWFKLAFSRIFTKMHAFYWKCVHFMQIRWKMCTFSLKMRAFSSEMHAFSWKCKKMRAFPNERPYPVG